MPRARGSRRRGSSCQSPGKLRPAGRDQSRRPKPKYLTPARLPRGARRALPAAQDLRVVQVVPVPDVPPFRIDHRMGQPRPVLHRSEPNGRRPAGRARRTVPSSKTMRAFAPCCQSPRFPKSTVERRSSCASVSGFGSPLVFRDGRRGPSSSVTRPPGRSNTPSRTVDPPLRALRRPASRGGPCLPAGCGGARTGRAGHPLEDRKKSSVEGCRNFHSWKKARRDAGEGRGAQVVAELGHEEPDLRIGVHGVGLAGTRSTRRNRGGSGRGWAVTAYGAWR